MEQIWGKLLENEHLRGSCRIREVESREKGILGSIALGDKVNPHGRILRVTSTGKYR